MTNEENKTNTGGQPHVTRPGTADSYSPSPSTEHRTKDVDVYFFCDFTERFVKIGITSDVLRRFMDLQTAHALPILPLGYFPGDRAMERLLHK